MLNIIVFKYTVYWQQFKFCILQWHPNTVEIIIYTYFQKKIKDKTRDSRDSVHHIIIIEMSAAELCQNHLPISQNSQAAIMNNFQSLHYQFSWHVKVFLSSHTFLK